MLPWVWERKPNPISESPHGNIYSFVRPVRLVEPRPYPGDLHVSGAAKAGGRPAGVPCRGWVFIEIEVFVKRLLVFSKLFLESASHPSLELFHRLKSGSV